MFFFKLVKVNAVLGLIKQALSHEDVWGEWRYSFNLGIAI
jgi:hypothetical protein